MAGRWFEQWQVGDRIVHEVRRTETDNLLFSCMTHNPQPLHTAVDPALENLRGSLNWHGGRVFSQREHEM